LTPDAAGGYSRRAMAADEPLAPAGTTPAPGGVARQAGRGGIAVATAKLYFTLAGLVQQVLLPKILGLGGYGAISSVLSIAGIAYNPIVSTSIQAVSRGVAHSPDADQPAAIRRTLSVQAALALPLAAVFFLLAEPIGRFMGSPHLVPGLRVISGVIFFYGLYAPFIGVVNGQKRFHYQAGFDIACATLRTGGLLVGAWWFATRWQRGVEGAAWGFVATAAVMFAGAAAVVGLGRAGKGGPSVREHLVFLAPLLLGQGLQNLLLQADLTLLRTYASASAVAAGLPAQAADPLVGAYRATQLFSFLPYQLLMAVTFVIFPMLATAHRDGDRAALARYVQNGVRVALVLAGLLVSVTSGLSAPLLRLVFSDEAAVLASRSMPLLTLGFGAFAIFGILSTVLNSLKHERAATAITTLAFSLVVLLCWVRVRGGAFGPDLLWRTALATSGGIGIATLGAALLVKRAAGAVVPIASLLRVLVAMGSAIAVGRLLPAGGKLWTLVACAAVAAVYAALLLLTRELGAADLALVRTVIARKQR